MSTQPNMSPVADIISVGAIIGSFAHLLPPLAALIAIIWYAIQVYESRTVQKLLYGHRIKAAECLEPPEILHTHETKPPAEAGG